MTEQSSAEAIFFAVLEKNTPEDRAAFLDQGCAGDLELRAEVERARGRRIHVRGVLTDGDEPLAEARAAFLHVPLEHFLATPEGRAAGEAWRRRREA